MRSVTACRGLRATGKAFIVGLATGLTCLACSKAEDADLLPPPESATHVIHPLLDPRGAHARFGPGWFPMEMNAEGGWRWMGAKGEIKVTTRASETPAHVRIEGWAPTDLLPAPATLEFDVDHDRLDSFVAPTGHFVKEYDVPTPAGGEVVFTIDASVTALPPGDSRALGYALVSFSWTY